MKHTPKTELLKANSKALQFCNAFAGFDFEKPHQIIKGCGNFTAKKIYSMITYPGEGFRVALLVMPGSGWRTGQLHAVRLSGEKFYPLRVDDLRYWDYNIDYFFSIGDFEKTRKQPDTVYYIIVQAVQYLREHHEKKLIFSERYKLLDFTPCGDGKGSHWISRIKVQSTTGAGERFEWDIYGRIYTVPSNKRPNDINDIIDKSGYIIRVSREALRQKAARLKAEREKAAFLATDYTNENAEILQIIKTAQNTIIKALQTVSNSEQAEKVQKAADRLRWLYFYYEKHLDHITARDYSSKTAADRRVEELREKAAQLVQELGEVVR